MINTEQAQYAINAAIHSIREACDSLLDKRKELEFKGEMMKPSEDVTDAIAVINLRLDTLAKVELKLLAPLKEEYLSLEQPIEHHAPGKLSAMYEKRQSDFIGSMMQGLQNRGE